MGIGALGDFKSDVELEELNPRASKKPGTPSVATAAPAALALYI